MRNFLTAGWRRYALAFVVVGASLGVIGACNPTKPPSPPPPTCAPGGGGACMAITPDQWTYTAQGEIKIFTVKNNGPDQSQLLFTGVFGGNASPSEFVTVQDNCRLKTLVLGDSCTIGVQHFGDAGAHHDTFLVVGSDNSQIDPSTGNRGGSAHLVGH
jgi:hypothetical protein